ncbi:MAG TPA: calcium/sodium antiporter [Thermoanaerobacterales bacterium]|nr:calcium/sodium antiporter [Thermoanaerobacterales bacterium]
MLSLNTILFFIFGLILIVKGADMFVESAIWIAEVIGIPSMIMGATFVSIATTLPELVVSLIASFQGHPGMAIGNPVGSIICNIGLILGICILIKPYNINRKVLFYKEFIMIGAGLLVLFQLKDNVIDYREGLILLGLLPIYFVVNYIESYSKKETIQTKKAAGNIATHIIKFLITAFAIIYGAHLVVNNGISLAKFLGIPERVISLTAIAFGTSLPELITSLTASLKGYHELSIGNIVGANILNLLLVIGVSAVINPLNVAPHVRIFDMPYALFIMFLLALTGFMGEKIERWQGGFFLLIYGVYLTILGIVFFD